MDTLACIEKRTEGCFAHIMATVSLSELTEYKRYIMDQELLIPLLNTPIPDTLELLRQRVEALTNLIEGEKRRTRESKKISYTEKGLVEFAEVMKERLAYHQEKKDDSWINSDMQYLLCGLGDNIQKYRNGGNPMQSAHELVDIANFCMMLYHRHVAMWVEQLNKEEEKKC